MQQHAGDEFLHLADMPRARCSHSSSASRRTPAADRNRHYRRWQFQAGDQQGAGDAEIGSHLTDGYADASVSCSESVHNRWATSGEWVIGLDLRGLQFMKNWPVTEVSAGSDAA